MFPVYAISNYVILLVSILLKCMVITSDGCVVASKFHQMQMLMITPVFLLTMPAGEIKRTTDLIENLFSNLLSSFD